MIAPLQTVKNKRMLRRKKLRKEDQHSRASSAECLLPQRHHKLIEKNQIVNNSRLKLKANIRIEFLESNCQILMLRVRSIDLTLKKYLTLNQYEGFLFPVIKKKHSIKDPVQSSEDCQDTTPQLQTLISYI